MKLVRKDDHSVAIIGTLERVSGMSGIAGAYLKDGQIGIDYDGATEIFWDEQETVVDSMRRRAFIDENRQTVYEHEIELVDDNAEEEA